MKNAMCILALLCAASAQAAAVSWTETSGTANVSIGSGQSLSVVATITAAYKAKFGDEPVCQLIKPSQGAHIVQG